MRWGMVVVGGVDVRGARAGVGVGMESRMNGGGRAGGGGSAGELW